MTMVPLNRRVVMTRVVDTLRSGLSWASSDRHVYGAYPPAQFEPAKRYLTVHRESSTDITEIVICTKGQQRITTQSTSIMAGYPSG